MAMLSEMGINVIENEEAADEEEIEQTTKAWQLIFAYRSMAKEIKF